MDTFREFWFEVGLPVLSLVVAIAAGIMAVAAWASSSACDANGRKMQIKTEWSLSTSCMIEVHGQWLPWTEVIPVERDGRIVFEPRPRVRLSQ